MLIKEILKKYNINIPINDQILNLDFDGEFTEYIVNQYSNEDTMYTFYDENHEIRILPNRMDTPLVYYSFKEGEDIGQSKFYNPKGVVVIEEVAVRNLNVSP